jgi:hypothetical protein
MLIYIYISICIYTVFKKTEAWLNEDDPGLWLLPPASLKFVAIATCIGISMRGRADPQGAVPLFAGCGRMVIDRCRCRGIYDKKNRSIQRWAGGDRDSYSILKRDQTHLNQNTVQSLSHVFV